MCTLSPPSCLSASRLRIQQRKRQAFSEQTALRKLILEVVDLVK
jgi:hypothetical protein